MNGGHKPFNNTELVMDDLCNGSKTVGCARSIGDLYICEEKCGVEIQLYARLGTLGHRTPN